MSEGLALEPRQSGSGVCVLNHSTSLHHFCRLCMKKGSDPPESMGGKNSNADSAIGRWVLHLLLGTPCFLGHGRRDE